MRVIDATVAVILTALAAQAAIADDVPNSGKRESPEMKRLLNRAAAAGAYDPRSRRHRMDPTAPLGRIIADCLDSVPAVGKQWTEAELRRVHRCVDRRSASNGIDAH